MPVLCVDVGLRYLLFFAFVANRFFWSATLQEKDIALAPITITAERELVIDFSKPFMDFSMGLIMQKPGDPPINIFAFLLPFNSGVWFSIVGVVTFNFIIRFEGLFF